MMYYLMLVVLLFLYMSLWFLLSFIKKRNDVADVAWGLGGMFITWTSFFLSGIFSVRGLLVGILVSIWGLRLSWHIYTRNKGKTEDYRYVAWRQKWGKWFYIRSYLQVYLLQGFFLFLIVFPVLLINSNSTQDLGFIDFFGVAVWLFGFYFEAVGDVQLSRFLKDPKNKGKLMQSGLWAYTRHPNYFGEVMQWWGIWLIALSTPMGWLGIIGPITITFLIVNVSGIQILEKKMEQHPAFESYKKRVSMFFPWPTKKMPR